ncbi:MAG: M15 family metallopeptidase [Bacteroidota bacterium]
MFGRLDIKYGTWLLIGLALEIILIVSFLYEPMTKLTPIPLSIRERQLTRQYIEQQPVAQQAVYAPPQAVSQLEKRLMDSGLVNVRDVVPGIKVMLKYSTKDNFTGMDLYGDLNECYLQKDVAEKLKKAQELLHKKYPYYDLLVLDGVRPLSIQKTMWDSLRMPDSLKWKYVSPPASGSLHNYGAAVDVTLVNPEGWMVDMGTPYDFFGELGYPSAEPEMLKQGKLTHRQMENRRLLREVMTGAGFTIIDTEWWHFNSCSLSEAKAKYRLIR